MELTQDVAEALAGSIIAWSIVGGIIFVFVKEDSNTIDNANWLQLFFICLLCGPLTLIGFVIYFCHSMLGKMGKLFNR